MDPIAQKQVWKSLEDHRIQVLLPLSVAPVQFHFTWPFVSFNWLLWDLTTQSDGSLDKTKSAWKQKKYFGSSLDNLVVSFTLLEFLVKTGSWELVVQWLRLHDSTAGSTVSTPGWSSKVPQASQLGCPPNNNKINRSVDEGGGWSGPIHPGCSKVLPCYDGWGEMRREQTQHVKWSLTYFKWQIFNGGGLRLLCWLFCLNTFFLPFFDPNSP